MFNLAIYKTLHHKSIMTLCRTVLFKNAVKIDFVKMQKQQNTQTPNKAKLKVLLFTS